MKKTHSIFIRALALILTLITAVSIFPLSVFALSADDKFVAPDAATIKAALGDAGELIYYNDFEGSTSDTDINGGAVTNGITSGMQVRVGPAKIVSDGGSKVINYVSTLDTSVNKYKASVNVYTKENSSVVPSNSGKSFIWSADIKLGSTVAEGYLVSMACFLASGVNVSVAPVYIHTDGTLYYGGGEITNPHIYDSARSFAKLSKSEYINIAIQVNVENNTFGVYVDGSKVIDGCKFLSDEQAASVSRYEGFENGFGISQIGYYRESAASNFNGSLLYLDKVTFYTSNEYISGSGTPADIKQTYGDAVFVAPDADTVKNGVSAGGKLVYYNNFDSTTGTADINRGAVTDGVSTGFQVRVGGTALAQNPIKGGKMLQYGTIVDTRSDGVKVNKGSLNLYTYQNASVVPQYSGKSFVYQQDIKISDTISSDYLFTLSSFIKSDDPATAAYDPIVVETRLLFLTTGGVLYYGNSANKSYTLERSLGVLPRDEFVNIALHVNVEKNTYDVYINGVKAVEAYKFLTDEQLAKFNGYAGFENGFALSQISIYKEWVITDDNVGKLYDIDNSTLYFSDTFVSTLSEINGNLPTDGGFSSSLCAEDFAITSAYSTSSAYWKQATLNLTDLRGGDDLNGVLSMAGYNGQVCLYVADNAKTGIYGQNLAGLDVAADISLTVKGTTPNGSYGYISAWTPIDANGEDAIKNGGWQYHLVTISRDSSGNIGLYLPKDGTDWVSGTTKIYSITPDTEFNIKFLLDINDGEGQTYYIYVNGQYVGKSSIISSRQNYNSIEKYQLAYQKNWSAELPGNSSGFMFNGFRIHCGKGADADTTKLDGLHLEVSKCNAYYYDDDADGQITDSVRKTNVPVLLHYNDFENQSITESGSKAPVTYQSTLALGNNLSAHIRDGAGEAIVSDENGGKAFTYKKSNILPSGFQAYYQVNGISGGGTATANSGKSFVISADIKLSAQAEGSILGACAKNAATQAYGNDFNVAFVYTKKDGGIYVSHKGEDADSGVYINDTTTAWKSNAKRIGSFSSDGFTNIAVAVNVYGNTYTVYIDGIDVTGELPFLTSADKAQISASSAYPRGFGYSYTRIQLLGSGYTENDAPITLDNISAYFADAPINTANGYFRDAGGKFYLYENGKKTTQARALDSLISVDEYGALRNGSIYIYKLSDYYYYLNGELILKNGLYSGYYTANSLLGGSGNRYFYDKDKQLIIDVPCYDISDSDPDTKESATGMSVSAKGVITLLNGMHSFGDGIRYYIDGVKQTGFFTVGGKSYFANSSGYLQTGIENIGNGSYYFFDHTTYEGTPKSLGASDVCVNDSNGTAYTSLEAAFAAIGTGQTLVLVKDVTYSGAVVFPSKNIKLDLKGTTLKADAVLIFDEGNVIDSSEQKGVLAVPKTEFVNTATVSDYFTFFSTEAGGFAFYKVKNQSTASSFGTTFSLSFRPSLVGQGDVDSIILGQGAEAAGISITVTLQATHEDGSKTNRSFVFSDTAIKNAYTQNTPLKLSCSFGLGITNVFVSYEISSSVGVTCRLGDTSFVPKYTTVKEDSIYAVSTGNSVYTILNFGDSAVKNNNSGMTVGTYNGKSYMQWKTSTTKYTVKLPTSKQTDLSGAYHGYHYFTFSIYSEKKSDARIRLYFNTSFGAGTEFPLNFEGWKEITLKFDGMTVAYPLPTFTGISLQQIGGSESVTFRISDIRIEKENFSYVVPDGVDVNDSAIYDAILANFSASSVGTVETRSSDYYAGRKAQANANCASSWASFKSTYQTYTVKSDGTGTGNGLFGITLRLPSNGYPADSNNNDSVGWLQWDEDRITNIYNAFLPMAQAYAFYGSDYYQDPQLLADIFKALDYCYDNFYGQYIIDNGVVGNWYPWRAGVPSILGPILALLKTTPTKSGGDSITQAQIEKYLSPYDVLLEFPNGAGSNLASMAYNTILAGALRQDYKYIAMSQYFMNRDCYKIFTIEEMNLGTDGGFFADGSFIQHSVTPYHGAYGIGFIQNVAKVTYLVHNTPFATPTDKLEQQCDFILDSFRYVMYETKLFSTTNGRSAISSGEAYNYNNVLYVMIQMLPYLPEKRADEFKSYLKYLMIEKGSSQASAVGLVYSKYAEELYSDESIKPLDYGSYTKVFGNMCRTVQHGDTYAVAIALSSTRIGKYESINGANEAGWYHGDGMIYIYTDSYDISSVFYAYGNPYLMPGVTSNSSVRTRTNIHPAIPNKYDFAGGVENGALGAVGFKLGYETSNAQVIQTFANTNSAKIEANKSYFMFDNEVVCIGSGIKDVSGTAVRTVVDNRLWRTDDKLSINGKEVTDIAHKSTDYNSISASDAASFYKNASSALTADYHKRITAVSSMHFTNMGGYVFLGDTNTLKYSKVTYTASSTYGTVADETKLNGTYSFLEILLDHGTGNASLNATYEYVYLPEASVAQTTAYAADPDVKIISKTDTVHAVTERDTHALGAVFFTAGELTLNEAVTPVTRIKTSTGACIMISTDSAGQTTVAVSEPTQNATSITVEVDVSGLSTIVCADMGAITKIVGSTAYLTVDLTGAYGSTFSFTVR